MGSKTPGLLTGPLKSEYGELPQAPVIIEGLKKIYKNWGLGFDASLVKDSSFERDSVTRDIKELLSSKIDGIFCTDEAVFKLFLYYYYENRKKFPENFAIIGSSPRFSRIIELPAHFLQPKFCLFQTILDVLIINAINCYI